MPISSPGRPAASSAPPWRLGRIVGHLKARRAGAVDIAEPTGLLTHHLVQDRETAGFIVRLLNVTRHHPAARWIGATEAFAAS